MIDWPDREEVLRRSEFAEFVVEEFVRTGKVLLLSVEALEEVVAFDGVLRLLFIVCWYEVVAGGGDVVACGKGKIFEETVLEWP